MRNRAFSRLAVTVVLIGSLVFASDAFAQFRPGVIGTRGARWAKTVRGRIVQTGVVVVLLVVLIRILRPELPRRRRKSSFDDVTCPENTKDFWDPPNRVRKGE
jgi:hypothetical protein